MPDPKNIVIYSTADWDNPFWTNKQHVAQQLSRKGYNVLYVESLGLRSPQLKRTDAKRILGRLKKYKQGLRTINSHLHVLSPLAIPGGGKLKLIKVVNKALVSAQIQKAITELKLEQHWAWTYNPTSYDLLTGFKPQKIIYHTVDDLSAAPGMDATNILRSESILLKNADVVFCTSQKLFENAKKQTHKPCYYFPNVVDIEHFKKHHSSAAPADLERIPSPRLGFIGAISNYKLDMELINSAALKHPEWSFVFIGRVGEGQPETDLLLHPLKNIFLLGPKSYSDVPRYMHHMDVGLIPCPINMYTQSMFPMKFFEYLASDTPVVARNIMALKEFLPLHYSYSTPQEFEEQIEKALQSDSVFFKHSEVLKKYTWESRLQTMLGQIKESSQLENS